MKTAHAICVLLLALVCVAYAIDSMDGRILAGRRARRRAHRAKTHRAKTHQKAHAKHHHTAPPLCNGQVKLKGHGKGQEAPEFVFSSKCSHNVVKEAAAWGYYTDSMMTTGWTELTIETNPSHTDLEQAYAAGYLEGAWSWDRMWQVYHICKDHKHESITDYFKKQDEYLRLKVSEIDESSTDPEDAYWFQVGLVIAQLDGVLDGYNSKAPQDKQLTKDDIWLMNSDGDVLDVERAATPGRTFKRVEQMNKQEMIELVSLNGKCSALVKWTGDDLLAGHTTWDDFSELYRSYKHYLFNFNHPSLVVRKSSFSSYPGFIASTDDFYILDSGIVIIETTLNILNEKLYGMCNPTSQVLAWIRNIVANRLAKTGEEWTKLFTKYNSGTYNDQWLVIDYNLFQPGLSSLKPGTLFILEQIPGYVETKDVSDILTRDSYWGSYNRPYFEKINEMSMYKHYSNVHGEMFSYRDCPRAKIFQRDQKNVKDVNGMKKLLMQNKWEQDEFSKGCPGNAIASRFDLEAPNCSMSRVANGATDSKVTSSKWIKQQKSVAIAGPTHDDQPPFTWNDPKFAGIYHEGQPDTWNFNWKTMTPARIPRALK